MEKEESNFDKVKRLADMFRNSGLAVTESEAWNKAREIVETEEKVKKSAIEKGIKPKGAIIYGIDTDDNKPINELLNDAEKEEKLN